MIRHKYGDIAPLSALISPWWGGGGANNLAIEQGRHRTKTIKVRKAAVLPYLAIIKGTCQ